MIQHHNERLKIHHDVPYDEGIRIISKSRLTLNVMSWHKGGMTERVANAMLNKAVCITDKTTYIERNFSDEKDIVMFDLNQIALLSPRVKELLSAEGKQRAESIAWNAYKKAVSYYTWDNGAEYFIKILSEIS